MPLDNLPLLPVLVLGRDGEIATVAAHLRAHRLVTIVGPGGMGKTTLAVAIAHGHARDYRDGVCFVDLAPVGDATRVNQAVQLALGIEADPMLLAAMLRAHIGDRRMLIVIDSCEHVIDAAAALAESLLEAAPELHVLATSREPLQADGEAVIRLASMGLPEQGATLDAVQAMGFPAVELFVRRVRAGLPDFVFDDHAAPLAGRLCRYLDGLPLAIELAAALVPVLGLERLVQRVDDEVLLLEDGGDGRPERHRTLSRVLDWSVDQLTPAERETFTRLSVFRGVFTLEAAIAVAKSDDDPQAGDVCTEILELTAKSLLTRAPSMSSISSNDEPTFRMLDTTRAYASRRLAGTADFQQVRSRHANFLCGMLQIAELNWESMTRNQWRAAYVGWIDDVRAALDWTLAPEGDPELGSRLAAAAFALAEQTSAMVDYARYARLALAALRRVDQPPTVVEMRLNMFPAVSHLRDVEQEPELIEHLHDAIKLGRDRGDPKLQLGAMVGLWAVSFQRGDYPQTLPMTRRISALGELHGDAAVLFTAKRTLAQTLHFLGDQEKSKRLAEEVCATSWQRIPLAYSPSPVSPGVSMRILLARIHWIQGRPESAMRLARECVGLGKSDSKQALCQALGLGAMPVAIWCGETAAAQEWLGQMRALADAQPYRFWQGWCAAHDLLTRSCEAQEPHRASALLAMRDALTVKYRDHAPTFDVEAVDAEILDRAEAGSIGWCAPEVLRAYGERILRSAVADAHAQARALFERAIALARVQGALSWEWRAAMSLARLRRHDDRTGMRDLLERTLARFHEGFGTRDLVAGRRLIEELRYG